MNIEKEKKKMKTTSTKQKMEEDLKKNEIEHKKKIKKMKKMKTTSNKNIFVNLKNVYCILVQNIMGKPWII
jgi:hypothetical protein